jgi:hypothetical protein
MKTVAKLTKLDAEFKSHQKKLNKLGDIMNAH